MDKVRGPDIRWKLIMDHMEADEHLNSAQYDYGIAEIENEIDDEDPDYEPDEDYYDDMVNDYQEALDEAEDAVAELRMQIDDLENEIKSLYNADADVSVVGQIDFSDTIFGKHKGVYQMRKDPFSEQYVTIVLVKPAMDGGSMAQSESLDPIEAVIGAVDEIRS